MKQTYRACIFDLDGTLADTLASIALFANGALEQFGFAAAPVEEYKYMVGNGADLLLRRALARVNGSLDGAGFAALRKEYDRRYEARPMELVTAYPGLQELLEKLHRAGMKLGVVSNKPDNMTRFIVRELYGDRIHAVHGQREGVPKKPDPAAVLETAKELGVSPKEVLYVGDSGVDMDTGRNAGMDTCGVLWGFRKKEELLEHGALFLAGDAAELEQIIHNKEERT